MTPLEVLAFAGVRLPGPCEEIVREENGCALWPFGRIDGYGTYYPENHVPGQPYSPMRVHRAVCAAFHGPIPERWHVDHVWDRGCRSRACFWPDHLEAVTQAENNRRMSAAIRSRRPRPCGHSWEDTRPGRSDCAICHRERETDRYVPKPHRVYEQGRERAREVLSLLAAGLSPKEVALAVGISRGRVYGIRRAASTAATGLGASC